MAIILKRNRIYHDTFAHGNLRVLSLHQSISLLRHGGVVGRDASERGRNGES